MANCGNLLQCRSDTMATTKQTNLEIQKENQNELRELEQFYVEGKIDTMLETIQEKRRISKRND